MSFRIERVPGRSAAERAALMRDPGFGRVFTDHMATVAYDPDRGWHDAAVTAYGPLSLDPAASVLHYGQSIFEGLKAYRQPDGRIATFRAEANAARFARSAARLAMPALPTETFVESLRALVDVDAAWVPDDGEASLYLRPFMISTDVGLGVRPSSSYLYLLIASPVGAYFPRGLAPVSVWLSTEYVRAAPGGTGEAKCAGNYAASLVAQAQAQEEGCDQVVWLDAAQHRWVEEMGGMNLFFVVDGTTLVTPELSGSLLAGVTRSSLLTLAADLGLTPQERRIDIGEWEDGCRSGRISEVFACGTAAVITPVGTVRSTAGSWQVGDGGTGAVTADLRRRLLDLQTGCAPDPHGWMTTLVDAGDKSDM